jgi:hypothetical protein
MLERPPRRGEPPVSPLIAVSDFFRSTWASLVRNRAWFGSILIVVAALLLAHAPSLPSAMRGDSVYAYAFDECTGQFSNVAAPSPPETAVTDGCDAVLTQRVSWEGWRRFRDAWESRRTLASFLFSDIWQVALDARTFTILDLILFVWPTRLLLPAAQSMALLHLGMVALAAAGGVGFARSLRVSTTAGIAAGLTAATSAVVLEAVLRGQYPQACAPASFAFFAGLLRLARGERYGVALTTAGASLATMLYWQSVVVLGLGALLFGAGLRWSGPFARNTFRRLGVVVVLCTVICLPAAFPVLQVMANGTESKFVMVPLGTPFPDITSDPKAMTELIDEVPWFTLLSLKTGWLPVLPLLPAAVLGLKGRTGAAWAFIAIFGAAMALGPLPVVPWHGSVVEGYSTLERGSNWLYNAVYMSVPTASRMLHPMRWAMLLSVAMTAATAMGFDHIRDRWPKLALPLLGAAFGWAMLVGPWPMLHKPFPRATVDAFEGCTDLIIAGELPYLPGYEFGAADSALVHDDVHRLEGLLWVDRSPLDHFQSRGPVGDPTPKMQQIALTRTAQLNAALAGDPTASASLAGACVIYEPDWVMTNGESVEPLLVSAFGPPTATVESTSLYRFPKYKRMIEVFRPSAAPKSSAAPK